MAYDIYRRPLVDHDLHFLAFTKGPSRPGESARGPFRGRFFIVKPFPAVVENGNPIELLAVLRLDPASVIQDHGVLGLLTEVHDLPLPKGGVGNIAKHLMIEPVGPIILRLDAQGHYAVARVILGT
ncbi:MAG: hypothetical protein QME78_00085 [Thermodesulfobacteriota bacterium]|nr:hypothetical protein [Thermodesulfobacteriota bacterium]